MFLIHERCSNIVPACLFSFKVPAHVPAGTGAPMDDDVEELRSKLARLTLEKESLELEVQTLRDQLDREAQQQPDQANSGETGEDISDEAKRKRMARLFKPRSDGKHVYIFGIFSDFMI